MPKKTDNKSKSGLFLITVLTIAGCLCTAVTGTPKQQDVLAVINGDTITSVDMDNLIIRTHKKIDMSKSTNIKYDNLLKKLVNDILILQQAYSLGMHENEQLVSYLHDKRKETSRKVFLSKNYDPKVTITKTAIDSFFNENLKRFQFRTISLNSLEEAQKIYDLLKQGHKFDSLAIEHSLDHRKMKNGLHLVSFKMNMDETLLNLGLKLDVGDFSEPFFYKKYYTIAKLEKRMDADIEKFDKYKGKIEEELTKGEQLKKWNKYIQTLNAKYPVSVDTTIVEGVIADRHLVLQKDFRLGSEQPVLFIDSNSFVTDYELRNEISKAIMTAATTPFEEMLNLSLDLKRDELLTAHEAIEQGYYENPLVITWYNRTLDSILIENYLKEMIVKNITFNREEFKSYYEENKELFKNEDLFKLQSMQIKDETAAKEAVTALKDGARWDYIFNKYDAVQIEEGDNFNNLNGYPPDVVDDIKKLPIGKCTDEIRTEIGYVIISVIDRKSGGYKSIEEVDMHIRNVMFQSKFESLLDEHLDKIKEKSSVAYFEENIDNYFNSEK